MKTIGTLLTIMYQELISVLKNQYVLKPLYNFNNYPITKLLELNQTIVTKYFPALILLMHLH